VLFIGGTGVISSACTKLCTESGFDLHLLNRGQTGRPISPGVKKIKADVRDKDNILSLLSSETYDVVVDWIAYTVDHVKSDFEIFKNRTSQYIFISSASAYQKPPTSFPIRETEPLDNPFWEYSRNKIQCEQYLLRMNEEYQFPVTIVRPSHTYDRTKVALSGGYTALNRMRDKKKIVIHGDGTSLWTLTHHEDFARGFLGLIGNKKAIGEAFHITSDEILTWNQICEIFGNVIGVQPNIVHIPSDFIHRYDKEWGEGLLGDKSHSLVFDNHKIKQINPQFKIEIPFRTGAEEICEWYAEDPQRQKIDPTWNSRIEDMISRYESYPR
jgi:nucleoside-diphosphate-sugar epimerase